MRRVIALSFLVMLLVEWGSHGLAFTHSGSDERASVQSAETGHEDPCNTLIRCHDGSQGSDQRKAQADAGQHGLFLNNLFSFTSKSVVPLVNNIERALVEDRYGSPDPPFHPPEQS